MTWIVRLHCEVCHTNIGEMEHVQIHHPATVGYPSLDSLRNVMREHEVEKHGGKS